METDRLPARGPRGETVIVIRTWTRTNTSTAAAGNAPAEEGRETPTYRLASGERLGQTDEPNAVVTMDGKRRFTFFS